MNTECVIKLLFLIGVIYLIILYLNNTVNFKNNTKIHKILSLYKHDNNKSINISLLVKDINYVFISFEDLKTEHKNKVINGLINHTNFANPKPPAKKENLDDMNNGLYIKKPIFIVKESEVSNLTDNKIVSFKVRKNSDLTFRLIPVVAGITKTDQFLFFDENLGMVYYSNTGNNPILLNTDGMLKNKGIIPVTFTDLELYVFGNKIQSEDIKYKISFNN